jgi:hypothetical protein
VFDCVSIFPARTLEHLYTPELGALYPPIRVDTTPLPWHYVVMRNIILNRIAGEQRELANRMQRNADYANMYRVTREPVLIAREAARREARPVTEYTPAELDAMIEAERGRRAARRTGA